MKKMNDYILKYIVFASPVVLAAVIWGVLQGQKEVSECGMFIYGIWQVLSFNLIIWFVALIYMVGALVVSSDLRNKLLLKIARIKERDEREAYIIAQSGRFSFFSTMALLILLFFFTTVNVSVSKLPEGEKIDGHRHRLSIELSYKFFETAEKEEQKKDVIFSTQPFPVTKQNIVLIVILWHLGAFYYASRKMQSKDDSVS